MSSKAVVFETAAIQGVKHKISNAAVLNIIEFVATYDPKTAVQLGQSKSLVYDQENIPKQGYKTVELDLEMHAFRLMLEPKSMPQHALDITPQIAHKFKVFKAGGKNKKATIRVKFVVSHTGSPDEAHRMLQYLIDIGSAPGQLTITPMQSELFGKEEKADKKARKKKDKPEPVQTTMPAAAEETNPVEPETIAAPAETFTPGTETTQTVTETSGYPQCDNKGNYPNDNADTQHYERAGKVAAFIEVLEVEGGFVHGWGAKLATFEETHMLNISTLCSSEARARKNAAEGVYRFAQKVHAGASPQVKAVAKELMGWATPFIANVRPEPEVETEEAVAVAE